MVVKTLQREVVIGGIGLHSGEFTQVRLLPASVGEGCYFVRVDMSPPAKIPAKLANVLSTKLSTELGEGEATVRTVEHLLAALWACGIKDVRIELKGSEIPLLDGSAKIWLEELQAASFVQTQSEITPPYNDGSPESWSRVSNIFQLSTPIIIQQADAYVAALPAADTRFTYEIEFDYLPIGKQWHSWSVRENNFATAIAPARTFGFADQVEKLHQAGLIKGGSLDNALVCDKHKWLNPPLRFANEPVRHKLLDLIGDLSLLGQLPQAHFLAYKASHSLHIQLAQKIAKTLKLSI
ncbi:MAG: UDP-3-O-acyl-N-acetylglucosamine deacetylase [Cyanobacteria bacterium J083]|nr:MAG: UDP-3-O-acyl-N-acetylglucosamine deacetylase [Cyanobacteria bacterium J083]